MVTRMQRMKKSADYKTLSREDEPIISGIFGFISLES
jgi:hypothetical protein